MRYELVRILSEALANVERHAEAGRVVVLIAGHDVGGERQIELTVRDDGRGFQPRDLTTWQTDGHFGRGGMHAGASRGGGELRLKTAPGAGTTLTASVPCRS